MPGGAPGALRRTEAEQPLLRAPRAPTQRAERGKLDAERGERDAERMRREADMMRREANAMRKESNRTRERQHTSMDPPRTMRRGLGCWKTERGKATLAEIEHKHPFARAGRPCDCGPPAPAFAHAPTPGTTPTHAFRTARAWGLRYLRVLVALTFQIHLLQQPGYRRGMISTVSRTPATFSWNSQRMRLRSTTTRTKP